jgi:FKBP-type peptidyl-prolyl cis-trans isomerase
MPRIILTLALTLLVALAPAAALELKTEEQKTLYALGLSLARNLEVFRLTPAELEAVQAGIADTVLKQAKQVELSQYAAKLTELQRQRAAVAAEDEKKAGEAFVAKTAGEKGAKKTDSGLVYVELKAGTGESPKASDKVKVHYTGTLTDGTKFDSSVDRGQPAQFGLNGVIKCWTEGLQMMKVGGKSKLVCPSAIAYGDSGRPPQIKGGATLVFEVELLEIVK